MKIENAFYLVLIGLSLLIFIYHFLNHSALKIKRIQEIQYRSTYGKMIGIMDKALRPVKNYGLYRWYENALRYTKTSVAEFFLWKLLILGLGILFVSTVHFTNVSIYTKPILEDFQYYGDTLYRFQNEVEDEFEALQEEIYYLNQAISSYSAKEVLKQHRDVLQQQIFLMIDRSEDEVLQPKLTIANKVYYRLYDYYFVRKVNISKILFSLLIASCIPDIVLQIYRLFIKADTKRELRFLKRLMILNGSIKPVDFMEVLTLLIHKSRYYQKILIAIERENKKNSIPNQHIYRKYIQSEKSIDVKLFFEKLDQGNNYDFDQAIINIENEFHLDRRQQIRRVRKQIELIHVWGIVGSFILIALLTVYMLMPWLTAYNMNQMF